MRIPGVKTAKQFTRWLRARIWGGALVLAYHRIAEPIHDAYELCVSPKHFEEQMEVVRKFTQPSRLSRIVMDSKEGSLLPRLVAVTFDDGYVDNLYQAKPILEKYDIPATVFICTGYLGKEFWWDELVRLVTCSRSDIYTFNLEAGGKHFNWLEVNATREARPSALRHELSRALYQFLLTLDIEDQGHAMEQIRSWAEVSSPVSSTPRAMSEQELMQLVDGGLLELGAHSRHHPMLPQLSIEKQRAEIQSSKRDLESLLGEKIAGFSYPNGRSTVDAKRFVRELDFSYACTSLHDVVRPGSDVYELGRFWQQDVDGEAFVKGLNRWMSVKVH
jgi:peptidoglycan/xylan/chitin deacetylase (PgdA/CDA1 family)